jgi:hypothetical protein
MHALEAAAEARNDIATLVIIDAMWGRENRFVRHLDALADPAKLDELLDRLSRFEPFDELWHILFSLVERDPSLLPRVEAAIAHWPDEHRLVPHAWWDRILAGERQEYFRLARNSGIKDETLDPNTIRRHAPCFHWLTELSLERSTLDSETLEQFLALPDIRRLKRLSLAGTRLQDGHAALLARAENLAALEWLDVSSNHITATGAASLIAENVLSKLEFLKLASCDMRFEALAAALSAASPRQRPLCLSLTGTTASRGFAPDPAGFAAFVRSEAFRGVAGLDLAFYKLTPEEAEALAQSPATTAFRRLELNERTLGETGMKAIFSARWIKNAERLKLYNQQAGDGIAPYLSSLSGGAIQRLELLHNNLGRASAHALGSIDLSNLRHLYLSSNPLGDGGAAAILRNKTLTNLEEIHMQGVGAGLLTARAIAENTSLRSLKIMFLGNDLGVESGRLLADTPHLASLRQAHLGGIPRAEEARLRASPHMRGTHVTVYR